MTLTVYLLLALWLGMNAALVMISLYATADHVSRSERYLALYSKIVNLVAAVRMIVARPWISSGRSASSAQSRYAVAGEVLRGNLSRTI